MPQKKTTAVKSASTTRKATAPRRATARRSPAAAKPAAPAVELTHQMIAVRAYTIWLKNNRTSHAVQDWLEAEKQLRAESNKKVARAKKPKMPQANSELRLAA